MLPYVLAILY